MELNFIGLDPEPYDYYLGVFGYGKPKHPIIPYHREFSDDEKEFFKNTPYEVARKSELFKEIITSSECTEYIEQYDLDKKQAATQKNWDNQKAKINEFIAIKLKLGDLDMPPVNVVMSTRPGSYSKAPDEKFIRWGHPLSNQDPCYDGRYLFHEWFHAVEDKYNLPHGEQAHAALELADSYLYKEVLGGKNWERDGHPELDELRNKIKPYFQEFISGQGTAKNFFEFCTQMIEKFPIKHTNI